MAADAWRVCARLRPSMPNKGGCSKLSRPIGKRSSWRSHPRTIARIKIQQAGHTAAAGRPAEAKWLLDEILATGATHDPLIKAEALLQRAMLLRSMGKPADALADLEAAQPGLHHFGSVMEEFEGDLEIARALREVGAPAPRWRQSIGRWTSLTRCACRPLTLNCVRSCRPRCGRPTTSSWNCCAISMKRHWRRPRGGGQRDRAICVHDRRCRACALLR